MDDRKKESKTLIERKMMKRIAVITMHAVKNYGSVLQTLATQRLFELHGLKPIIIDYRRPWDTGFSYYFDVKGKGFKDILKQFIFFPSKIKQRKIFGSFLKKYINLTKYEYRSMEDFDQHPIDADVFCTGSDQVWNSGWNRGMKKEFFLSFVPEGKKKVSFAASIGKASIDEEEKKAIAEYLKSYNMLSVRERSSVEFLNQIGFDNVELVLDPTLQLPQNEWRNLVGTDHHIASDYVLLIQLNRNKEFDHFAVRFAREHGKRLLRLCLRIDQAILPGKAIIIPDVIDYLRYIADADYVLTDSFHAVSFCLGFEKNFYCVLPELYSSRIKSILTDLNLMDRIVEGYSLSDRQVDKINYKKVNILIDGLRSNSLKYLDRISSI